MADALRAAKVVPEFGAAVTIHLVETSLALRERQAAALPGLPVRWHDELAGLPTDRPLLVVANEFLDALPVRQFVRRSGRWHERLIGVDEDGALRFVVAPRATPFPQAVGGRRAGSWPTAPCSSSVRPGRPWLRPSLSGSWPRAAWRC